MESAHSHYFMIFYPLDIMFMHLSNTTEDVEQTQV